MELIINKKCDVCVNESWSKYSEELIVCKKCGLVRADFRFNEADFNDIYSRNYFFGDEYWDYIKDKKALEFNFLKRIKKLSPYLVKDAILIEIGCAYGFFLSLVKDKVKKVIGFEISKEASEYAKNQYGLEIYNVNFLNYSGEDVDLICMFDVIEHLPNPGEVISHASAKLKKGGVLMLTTGDIGSLMAKIRGNKWRLIHPPTHLFYFDRNSIYSLLEKNNLKIVSFEHPTVYRNVGSVFEQIISLREKKQKSNFLIKKAYSLFKFFHLTKLNFGINTFDIMEVIAIKS